MRDSLICPVMTNKKVTLQRISAYFNFDLQNPKTVFIEKETVYCNQSVTSKTVITSLKNKYSNAISRSENIDLSIGRLDDEASYRGAFLEWRYDGLLFVENQMDLSPRLKADGTRIDVGNPGGGIVAHANIQPERGDINYVRSTNVYLWNDEAMATYYQDLSTILSNMARHGYGVGDLKNKSVIDSIKLKNQQHASLLEIAPGSPQKNTSTPSSNDSPMTSGEEWTGTYDCTQGKTGLHLTITEHHGQQINANIEFYKIPETKVAILTSSYSASGALQPDGTLVLKPIAWINRPANYFMATLNGVVDSSALSFSGYVPECGVGKKFSLSRQTVR